MRESGIKIPIRIKLIIFFSLLVLLITVFNFTYYPNAYKKQALVDLENHLHNMAEVVALSSGISLELLDFESIGIAVAWAKKDSRLSYLAIFDNDNSRVSTFNPQNLKFDQLELLKKKGMFELDKKMFLAVPIVHKKNKHGTVLLGLSLDNLNANIQENKRTTLYICLGVFSFGIIISVIFSGFISKPIVELTKAAEEVSKGNTEVEIEPKSNDEIGDLGICFNDMVQNIKRSIHKQIDAIANTAETLSVSSHEIASSIRKQAVISTQQSATVSQITATIEELSTTSSQIADNSNSVVQDSASALDESKRGVRLVDVIKTKMDEITRNNQASIKEILHLGENSKEIGKVMDVINNIADQTKLIAFNAALEASSAGEAGKRFGVVAVEIRRLADNVRNSTDGIKNKIAEIQETINRLVLASEKESKNIGEGSTLAEQTLKELGTLVAGAKTTNDAAAQISLSTKEQKMATKGVVTSLKEIEKGALQASTAMQQTTSITSELTDLAQELTKLVDNLQGNTNGQPPAKNIS